ncbi:alpha-ketoglutarate-dependent dioxygenase AlkB family protein [Aquimarina algiphila]|uniref:alpha-ketoglutarate-dependent dioxygenase AlkB family protein n=1 Tax=Aquimarina algiphila TaxID=2047982 RepID=UPI00232E80AB|nr:alpha-ketoglutarate-dependent dioxygenase AlkB [Aquimarina algiphila]
MNLDLFSAENDFIKLDMPDADVVYYPELFSRNQSDVLFETLLKTIDWQQDNITVFGKTYPQPRLTALYSDNDQSYSYSNITMYPKPFTTELVLIKEKIEPISQITFTTCLLNLYRNGQDSNGWHSDNEKELGKHPVIGSVSLGEERWLHFKNKKDKNQKHKIKLQHGSLLLMKGKTQEYWLHQIPKTKKVIRPRINITFRVIK